MTDIPHGRAARACCMARTRFFLFFAMFPCLLALTPRAASAGQEMHAGHALGVVDFPVSCSDSARPEFTRAIALFHHMTYPQARAAFERVAELDPDCAMAHWGVAMTLFQPLWPTRPGPADLQRGWDETQRAKALAPATERERLFVAAAEAFFTDPASKDYWQRIRRWEQAQKALYDAFPDDPETQLFFALAHLATARADTIDNSHAERAARIILRVYEGNPEHPGAMHYLVHANDAPGREQEQLEITRKYESIAPRNPHALHMPTHIYTRLGDWDGVIRGNLRAAEAALEHPAGDQGQYVWDEFPHALEYLIYAYLQTGEDARAAETLKRLQTTAHLEPTFKTAFHIASMQSRYALERHDWKMAARLEPRTPASLPWDRFAWPEGIVRFARGIGLVHAGRLAEADSTVRRLDALAEAMRAAGETLFARNLRVLRLELQAWVAHARHHEDAALAAMREAADLERATPKHAVTPGPTLPAAEQLGDLLMELQRPADALAAYRESLESYPRRLNSVLGAARAAKASGDAAGARKAYGELLALAKDGSRAGIIREARAGAK